MEVLSLTSKHMFNLSVGLYKYVLQYKISALGNFDKGYLDYVSAKISTSIAFGRLCLVHLSEFHLFFFCFFVTWFLAFGLHECKHLGSSHSSSLTCFHNVPINHLFLSCKRLMYLKWWCPDSNLENMESSLCCVSSPRMWSISCFDRMSDGH